MVGRLINTLVSNYRRSQDEKIYQIFRIQAHLRRNPHDKFAQERLERLRKNNRILFFRLGAS